MRARPLCRAVAALCLLGAPAAAQTRLGLAGGFLPDPMSFTVTATGAEPAEAWVRGCPGYVAGEPALIIGLAAPAAALRFSSTGAGVPGLVVRGPDGVYRCGPADAAGRGLVRVDPMAAGDHAVWPLLAAPDRSTQAQLFVSEADQPGGAASPAAVTLDVAAPPAAAVALGAERIEMPVTLAGTVDAAQANPACTGLIDPSRPDARLTAAAPLPALAVAAAAGVDTTLIVVGPDGATHCVDDADGLDPALLIAPAPAGDWAVWVGHYDAAGAVATLSAAAAEPGDAPEDTPGDAPGAPAPLALDRGAPPAAATLDLPADGGVELALSLSAVADAAAAAPGCAGWIDPSRPDVVLRLGAAEPTLAIGAHADADATLIVLPPDGPPVCGDDGVGLDPTAEIAPAAPGDYAIWVGAYGAEGGGAATLYAERDPAALAARLTALQNPFNGREFASAVEALNVLMEDPETAREFAWERLEETGPEGFVLHGVTLVGPDPAGPPIRIARVVVSDLDLPSLAATGAPDRFALALEGIDYASLAAALSADLGAPGLPPLPGTPTLSLRMGLLPQAADPTRRDATLDLALDGQFGLGISGVIVWPEGDAPFDPNAAPLERLTLELRDTGFLNALFEQQARDMGIAPDDIAALMVDGLRAQLDTLAPDADAAKVVTAFAEALEGRDAPGSLRLTLSTTDPRGLAPLLGQIETDPAAAGRLEVEASYAPMP